MNLPKRNTRQSKAAPLVPMVDDPDARPRIRRTTTPAPQPPVLPSPLEPPSGHAPEPPTSAPTAAPPLSIPPPSLPVRSPSSGLGPAPSHPNLSPPRGSQRDLPGSPRDSNSGSDDDYEKSQQLLLAQYKADALAPRPPELLEQDADAEDDREMDIELSRRSRRAGRLSRAPSEPCDTPGSDAPGSDSDDESGSESVARSGPWPMEAVKEAFELQREHHLQLAALAAKHGKTLRSALQIVGLVPSSSTRAPAAWQTYLKWTASSEYDGPTPPDDLPTSEYSIWHRMEYVKTLRDKGLSEAEIKSTPRVFEILPWLREWADAQAAREATFIRDGPANARAVKGVLREFSNLAGEAYRATGVHVIGYVLNPVKGGSGMFAGSPAAEAVLMEHDGEVRKKELESLVHVAQMKLDGESHERIFQQQVQDATARSGPKTTRDSSRGLLPTALRSDLTAIFVARDPDDPETISQLKWGTQFIDFAYTRQITLRWDAKLAAVQKHPGKHGFKIDSIPAADLARITAGLNARAKEVHLRDALEHALAEEAICIYSWTNEQRLLAVALRGSIPLLAVRGKVDPTDPSRRLPDTTITTVAASAKWKSDVQKLAGKKPRGKRVRSASDDAQKGAEAKRSRSNAASRSPSPDPEAQISPTQKAREQAAFNGVEQEWIKSIRMFRCRTVANPPSYSEPFYASLRSCDVDDSWRAKSDWYLQHLQFWSNLDKGGWKPLAQTVYLRWCDDTNQNYLDGFMTEAGMI